MGQLIDEVANYLAANGIGTVGTNLFEGLLPASPDSAVAIIETAGSKPDEYLPTYSPSFQVLVRSTAYDLGRTVCDNIRTLLHNKYNVTLVNNGNYYFWIRLITEGGHLGQDQTGRDLFSMNFEVKRRN